MYKVFLVDDEYRIKERIMSIESWENSPFNFCGEASDGEMALCLISELKPDIVIADIEMPFMNGLELAGILKSSMPWIKVVFLSGHDEFEYAKEAVKLGVSDYLLKPVRIEELRLVLNKMAEAIEQDKKNSLEIANLKMNLESAEKLKKDTLFEQLLSGFFDAKELLDQFKSYDVDILAKNYMVMDVKIHSHSRDPLENGEATIHYPLVKNIAVNHLDKVENLLWYYKICDRMIILLRGDNGFELKEQAFSIASSIKYDVNTIEGHETTIGIGSVVTRLKQVALSFLSANKARTFLGDLYLGQILFIDDVENQMFEHTKDSEGMQLSRIGLDEIDAYIDQNAHLEDNNSGLMQYYNVISIFFECVDQVTKSGGDARVILPSINEKEIIYMFATDKTVLHTLLYTCIEKMIQFKDAQGNNKYNDIIRNAKEYIQKHFNESRISLNEVAKEVNLSPNHFSMIFSNETNHTFIEYLTRTRLQKAKELLCETEMRLADIAYEVGYNEPQYFSYMFKKNYGLSPKEYRTQKK
jgi:two-component system, response regulator YesN